MSEKMETLTIELQPHVARWLEEMAEELRPEITGQFAEQGIVDREVNAALIATSMVTNAYEAWQEPIKIEGE